MTAARENWEVLAGLNDKVAKEGDEDVESPKQANDSGRFN